MDEKQLSIDIVGLAGAYSYALDCIEAELVNITNKHGKRVVVFYSFCTVITTILCLTSRLAKEILCIFAGSGYNK